MKNYFQVLKVDINADTQTIKKAYRKLCKVYHPDLNTNKKDATQKFNQLQIAYQTLIDPVKRMHYQKELELQLKTINVEEDGFENFISRMRKKRQTTPSAQKSYFEDILKKYSTTNKKTEPIVPKQKNKKNIYNQTVFTNTVANKKHKEESVWAQSVVKNTREAYQSFILSFPQSHFVKQAQLKLHALQYQSENFITPKENLVDMDEDNFDISLDDLRSWEEEDMLGKSEAVDKQKKSNNGFGFRFMILWFSFLIALILLKAFWDA